MLKCGFHNSPVNLGMFEAKHQTNRNRIVFNAIEVRVAYLATYQRSAKIRLVEHVKIKR